MKQSTQIVIVGTAFLVFIIIWFACIFDNLLDFLIALWSVFFLVILAFCITAVVAVLLYDYFNRG